MHINRTHESPVFNPILEPALDALAAFDHLLNLLAPALCVAGLTACLVKLLWRSSCRGTSWLKLTLWGSVGGYLGLMAAVLAFGGDGHMAGYGLLLLGVALPESWLAFGRGA